MVSYGLSYGFSPFQLLSHAECMRFLGLPSKAVCGAAEAQSPQTAYKKTCCKM
jgi:hypothetical protein